MMGVSVIILAAGAARRMNQAKMLLPFEEHTILETIIGKAKEIKPDHICVVTGYYHNQIVAKVSDHEICFVYNEQWEQGMSTSIKKGLGFLTSQDSNIPQLLIMVADQPYISTSLLQKMLQLQIQSNKSIVAACYAGVAGTPVLFQSKHFSNLEKLTGDKGARSILQQYPDDLVTIDFPLGKIDIDTVEDFQKLSLNKNNADR